MSAFRDDLARRHALIAELAAIDQRKARLERLERRLRRAAVITLTVPALIVAPLAAAASAHTIATSCTHSTVGVLHRQTFVTGRLAGSYHTHTVHLTHLGSATGTYDTVVHNHRNGGCAT